MRLGWLKCAAVAMLLSLFSNPLCALDFEQEIAKQNAKGKSSMAQLSAQALGEPAGPKAKERSPTSDDGFEVRLSPRKVVR